MGLGRVVRSRPSPVAFVLCPSPCHRAFPPPPETISVPNPADPLLAIFDHDGVLVDSLDYHQRAWLELGSRTGLPITAEFIHETFGMTNPSIFERLLGKLPPASELQRYSDLKETCYRVLAGETLCLME